MLNLKSIARPGRTIALYEFAGFRRESPPEASDSPWADVRVAFRG